MPIVFSSEINCYPYVNFSYMYKEGNSAFKYLHSSGYSGRAGDLLKLYESPNDVDYHQPLVPDRQNHWSN